MDLNDMDLRYVFEFTRQTVNYKPMVPRLHPGKPMPALWSDLSIRLKEGGLHGETTFLIRVKLMRVHPCSSTISGSFSRIFGKSDKNNFLQFDPSSKYIQLREREFI